LGGTVAVEVRILKFLDVESVLGYAIDYICKNGCFSVSESRMTISKPDSHSVKYSD
jgi:hypothetical protein